MNYACSCLLFGDGCVRRVHWQVGVGLQRPAFCDYVIICLYQTNLAGPLHFDIMRFDCNRVPSCLNEILVTSQECPENGCCCALACGHVLSYGTALSVRGYLLTLYLDCLFSVPFAYLLHSGNKDSWWTICKQYLPSITNGAALWLTLTTLLQLQWYICSSAHTAVYHCH